MIIRPKIRDCIRNFAKYRKPEAISVRRYALILYACELGQNQTPIERNVEEVLLDLENIKFRSQVPIEERYIVDFVVSGNVIIECDGEKFHKQINFVRDEYLCGEGYRVLHLFGKTCMDKDRSRIEIERFLNSDASLRYC